jgi:hypothetical protein
MFAFLLKLLFIARARLKVRASLEAENLVLRQQVIVLSRKSRSRVWLRNIDRLIVVCLPKTLSGMMCGWAYGNEAADGGVSDPAAAYYPVAVHAARAT